MLNKRDQLRIDLWYAYYHGATEEKWRELVYRSVIALDEAERAETHLRLAGSVEARSSLAYAERRTSDAARISALQEALRDVLAVVWSGSSADRKFWRDEAVATFERAAALAQADTAFSKRSESGQ